MTTRKRESRHNRWPDDHAADGRRRIQTTDQGTVLVGQRYVPVLKSGYDGLKEWAVEWERHQRRLDPEVSARGLIHGTYSLEPTVANTLLNAVAMYALQIGAYRKVDWLEIDEYDARALKRSLRLLQKEGVPVISPKFVAPGSMKGNRLDFICDDLLAQVAMVAPRVEQDGDVTARRIVDTLRQADGCGKFLAWNAMLDSIIYGPALKWAQVTLPDNYVVVSTAARHGMRALGMASDSDAVLHLTRRIQAEGADMRAYDVEHMLQRFLRAYVKQCVADGTVRLRYVSK